MKTLKKWALTVMAVLALTSCTVTYTQNAAGDIAYSGSLSPLPPMGEEESK